MFFSKKKEQTDVETAPASAGSQPAPDAPGLMGMTGLLNAAADNTPDQIATVMNGRRHSWNIVRDRVARFAGALRKLNVGPGDRIAVLALNSDRYTELYFASWWSGGAIVPMNLRWSVDENVYSLDDAEAEILIVDDAFAPMAGQIMEKTKTVRTVIHMGDGPTPESFLSYDALIAENEPVEDAGRSGEDLAGLYYTGGTTGFPKGVMLPHRALWYNSLVAANHASIGPEDIYLHVAPMFHLADGAGGNALSAAGGRHTYLPMFTPDGAIDMIEAEGVTIAVMVPTMIAMLLASPNFDPARLKSLKKLIYGASPMPAGVLKDLMEKLPNLKLLQGYGQTELAPMVSMLTPQFHVTDGPKLKSAGRAVIGAEIRIEREDGTKCDYGEVGEIVVRSPGAMQGYWKLPEQTADTLKNGWVYTGDGAYMDREGFIFIVDRIKDMIVTGGENVFSAEVESAISTHPAVAEVAVIGIPAEQWGEAVHAIIVCKPGMTLTQDEIVAHCREKIANYKLPRSVSFRTDPLPLSGAGKVLKRDLRKPFWDGQDRAVN